MRFLFLIIKFFIIKMQLDSSNNELTYFNNYINSLIENIESNKFNQTYNNNNLGSKYEKFIIK